MHAASVVELKEGKTYTQALNFCPKTNLVKELIDALNRTSSSVSLLNKKVKVSSQFAIIKNTITLFVCPSKIFYKDCFQFLLGPMRKYKQDKI